MATLSIHKRRSPVKTGKKDAILAAAGKLFAARGFAGVSMDDIATTAPVSKPTLYAHFKDKAELFLAVFEKRCDDFLGQIREAVDFDEPPATALPRLANVYLGRIFSDDALRMMRVIIAAGAEFPDIGARFYKSGPRRMETLIADYLREQHRQKRLRVPHPAISAEMFMGLLKGNRHMQSVLGMKGRPAPHEMQRTIRAAVGVFLAAHRA
jgi:TetR/AcrR family transcriptional repressor of mexJK operon